MYLPSRCGTARMIELYFSLKYSETRHEVIFQGGNKI